MFFDKDLIKKAFQSPTVSRKFDFDIEKQIILFRIWQLTTAFFAILIKLIYFIVLKLSYMIISVILQLQNYILLLHRLEINFKRVFHDF